jgi:hypothetical protein
MGSSLRLVCYCCCTVISDDVFNISYQNDCCQYFALKKYLGSVINFETNNLVLCYS